MGSNKERFYNDIMAMHPEVTGSCNLVIVKLTDGRTIRFAVDCGLFQEKEYEEYNTKLPFKPEKLDFCLVTHNHVDHTGRLPLLVRKGYSGKIYATRSTCQLLPLALNDCYKVLKGVAKRKNKKQIYKKDDVDVALSRLVPCNYNETIKIHENVRVRFLSNGHLIGAALILVQISYPGYDNINLLFTGDYNNKNAFFDVKPIPDWILDLPLTIIQESTYGDMESNQMQPCFKKNVLECIQEGGTVVAPVFSLGRSQEVLYELKRMQDEGELDVQVPIYFDGKLAIRYTELYLKGSLDVKEEMMDFLPQNLTFVDKLSRSDVLASEECKIILTTSGMGSYGPAQTYIPRYIKQKGALIQFTGYTAEDTLGSKLKEAEYGETVEVGGTVTKKFARVEYTTEYSAHAKADEMIDFLKQFRNLKSVLVNHGEAETKEIFAKRIFEEIDPPKGVRILGRDYFYRVNPYGVTKNLPTKFN